LNRIRFRERRGGVGIPDQELERMWRVYQEQLLIEQLILEAANQGLSYDGSSSVNGIQVGPTGA
jgi:predicted ABC-type ATPase